MTNEKRPVKYDPETGDSEHRKEAASYYTSSAAATLLVGMTFGAEDHRGRRVRIFDPACGSGILLAEGMRQARDRGAARVEIYGADINGDAVKAARERCKDADLLDIRLMPFGRQPDGSVKCGSLELIADGGNWPWPGAMQEKAWEYRGMLEQHMQRGGGSG